MGERRVDQRVFVEEMRASEGGVDLFLRSEVFPHLVEMLAVAYEDSGAENYLEVRGYHDRMGLVTLRVQRHNGLTPHQARERAEKKLAAAERLCRIYFDIAAEQIGEDAVRRRRDTAIRALAAPTDSPAESEGT